MRISNFNIINIGKSKKNQNSQSFGNAYIPTQNISQKDVFRKSNSTFYCGYDEEKVMEILHRVDLDDVESYDKTIVVDVIQGMALSEYIKTFLNPVPASHLKSGKYTTISELNKKMFSTSESPLIDFEFINSHLQQFDLGRCDKFTEFMQTHARISDMELYGAYPKEEIIIYKNLEHKEDLSKYSYILLEACISESEKLNPDFSKINEVAVFLNKIGMRDDSDSEIYRKFAHIAPAFNNFDTIEDVFGAVDYLRETYPAKIEALSEIIANSPELKSDNPEKLYLQISDLVDYAWMKSGNRNLDELSGILEYALKQGKIKIKDLRMRNVIMSSPEGKISFFNLLKNNGVSVSSLNSLNSRSIVSDISALDMAANRKYLSQKIAGLRGTDEKQALQFYDNFADVLGAICADVANPKKQLKLLFRILDENKIKSSDTFMSFYNKACGCKKKSLNSDEIKEFVGLFEYANSFVVAQPKKGEKPSIQDMIDTKKRFESVKSQIDDFKKTDKSGFFTGQTSLDIYKKYQDLIDKNPSNVAQTLRDVATYDIANLREYENKVKCEKDFVEFFNSEEEMRKFFEENEFNFDGSNDSEANILNYLIILRSVKNSDKTGERLKYFTTSSFLESSQDDLTRLLKAMPKKETREEILGIIADKKIPSTLVLQGFIKEYGLKNSNGVEIIDFIKNLPKNVDFNTAVEKLSVLQKQMQSFKILTPLNADNIKFIDFGRFNENSISSIIITLNNVLQAGDCNFIGVAARDNNKVKYGFSSYKIAQEIAKTINKTDESYSNISRLLKLDELDVESMSQVSESFYVKSIEAKISKEFVDFVNSDDYLPQIAKDGKTPNVSLHAKLRAIDRFVLNDVDNINELYGEKSKEKLKRVFGGIYVQNPINVYGVDELSRIVADYRFGSNIVEAVFSCDGEVITIVEKKRKS